MAFNKRQFIAELKRRKEGILIGAVTGAVAAGYAVHQGIDLLTIAEAGKGLIDSVLTRSAPVEVATYKIYGVFVFLGATIGFFADMMIDRFMPKRRRRRR